MSIIEYIDQKYIASVHFPISGVPWRGSWEVSDLRSQISRSQISDLRSPDLQISDLRSQISDLRSQISDLQISDLRSQISDLHRTPKKHGREKINELFSSKLKKSAESSEVLLIVV